MSEPVEIIAEVEGFESAPTVQWFLLPEVRRALQRMVYDSDMSALALFDRVVEASRVDRAGGFVSEEVRDRYLAGIITGKIFIGS